MCSELVSNAYSGPKIYFSRFYRTKNPPVRSDRSQGDLSVFVCCPLWELSVQQEAISLIHSQFLCDKMGWKVLVVIEWNQSRDERSFCLSSSQPLPGWPDPVCCASQLTTVTAHWPWGSFCFFCFFTKLYFMKHFPDNTSVWILFYEFIHTGFNRLDLDGKKNLMQPQITV